MGRHDASQEDWAPGSVFRSLCRLGQPVAEFHLSVFEANGGRMFPTCNGTYVYCIPAETLQLGDMDCDASDQLRPLVLYSEGDQFQLVRLVCLRRSHGSA